MNSLRHHVSVYADRRSALSYFHTEVIKRTESLIGHTFFEIVCPAPEVLRVSDLEEYASEWVDRGWSADVVTENRGLYNVSLSLRLRSYVDTFPF